MNIQLATDGSALAYANCGGWAYIRRSCDGDEDSHAGHEWRMGSNQSELWAILQGLSSISQSEAEVTVYTDSHYVINGVKKRRHGHLTLWAQLYDLLQIHKVSFVKVGKGRSNPLHTRAHHLAREAVFHAVRSRGSLSDSQGCNIPDSVLRLSG